MKRSNPIRSSRGSHLAGMFSCLLFAFIAAAAPAVAAPDAAVAEEKTTWRTDLSGALEDAAKRNKTVLLRFTASWCAPCRVMDAKVWPDPAVQAALSEDYIIVKSDIDEDASQILAQKYGVRGVPTLLLLDASGKEITRGGFMSPVETAAFLQENLPTSRQ